MTIRVETTGAPQPIPGMPGLGFPPGCAVIAVAEPGHPVDVTVWVRVAAGQLTPVEVTVTQQEGGPPVAVAHLRSVQLAQLVKYAAGAIAVNDQPDSALGHVARAYHLAVLAGEPPVMTVATQLGKTRAAATKLIAAAKKAGLL